MAECYIILELLQLGSSRTTSKGDKGTKDMKEWKKGGKG
jgi:hypothetical protein